MSIFLIIELEVNDSDFFAQNILVLNSNQNLTTTQSSSNNNKTPNRHNPKRVELE